MLYLKHGGHVLDDTAKDAENVVKKGHAFLARRALPGDEVDKLRRTETPFDYLLPQLKARPDAHLPGDPASVVAALNKLGTAMVDNAPPAQANPRVEVNSTIPAVYTYWGQFVDHDLTANTDRDSATSDITRPDLKPVPPDEVTAKLKNLRRPNLDLDSVYGDGPGIIDEESKDAGFYVGARFRIGRNSDNPAQPPIDGIKIPPEGDLDRDLPRIGPLLDAGVITEDVLPDALKDDPSKRTRAFIGDLRNDENLVIAQLHLAFLRFHNAVVDRIEANPRDFGLWPGKGRRFQAAVFHCARDVTRHIYQRITVHDYLRTVMFPGVVDKILAGGPKHYRPLRGYQAFMPLEYSVAAFRFGHTMVRGAYDHNRNFGKPAPGQTQRPLIPFAPFDLLFLFTGNGFLRDPDDPTKSIRNPFGGTPTLPFNWIIEWDRFTEKGDPDEGRFARKIDTRLAPPLTTEGIVNEGTAPPIQDEAGKALRVLLRHLARRNLLRGYLLSIPTGQAVAAEMGVAPLSEEELRRGNTPEVNTALDEGGFLRNTPLWYYVLKEAEVRADGNSLGELGSRIVCETVIGLLRIDRNSIYNGRGWTPVDAVRLPNGDPIVTIRDFLRVAGVMA
jgi:hypothetical protein